MRSAEAGSFRRHDRVWLEPSSWRNGLRGAALDAERLAAVDDWLARGRACVVRRRDPVGSIDDCALAIALPLAMQRARIAWTVDAGAVVRRAPPLRLDEVIAAAPVGRQAALDDLQRRAARLGVVLGVYGSYAWQAISGEPCVAATSDLDLLWDVDRTARVAPLFALFAAWEAGHGLRIDGELRFPDGASVAWRELAASLASGRRVLVKRDDGVALEPSPLERGTPRA